MNEKKAIFILTVLKNIINIYFDTFFIFYFFKVTNYEVLPLAKYYLTLYIFLGLGFFLIRNAMKNNIKVPYFRIGISLQALFIALIMLLKENIINYIIIVGMVKGIADGFYHYPKNILNTEKISNDIRQKFNGTVNAINMLVSIIMPLILGILLTYFSYTNIAKVFFVLFIIKFIVSFSVTDEKYYDKKFHIKKIWNLIKENKNIRNAMLITFLAGLTHSSGVMGTIITLSKINSFKTNLNLGFVDSLCGALSLIICILFTLKIKNTSFKKIMSISGIVSFISLVLMGIYFNVYTLIIYLLVRFSFIIFIILISDYVITNLANCKDLKEELKPEYYFFREVLLSTSRVLGYIILLIVSLFSGIQYISYILIICAIAILTESILVSKLSAIK